MWAHALHGRPLACLLHGLGLALPGAPLSILTPASHPRWLQPGPHGGWWVDPFRAVKVSSTAGRYKLIEFKQGYELYDLVQVSWPGATLAPYL